MKRLHLTIISLFTFLLLQQSAFAQYFGRNKVQYEDFNFKVLETRFFDIYYYPEEAKAVGDAARMLERWNNRFSLIWGAPISEHQPIVLYANHADFQQTNVVSGFISQGTGGVTEGLKNRITLPFTGVCHENDHVLGHELVHAFQYEIIKANSRGLASAAQTPLWFIEGLAEYLSIGRSDPLTAMWMRDAVLNDDVPTIDDISGSYKYFPYRYGHALWTYIGGTWGDEVISPLFRGAIDSGFVDGIEDVLTIDVDSLSSLWQESIKTTYQPQIEGKQKPSETGTVIRNAEDVVNLSPVVSPNGEYVALITSEGLFTLDLYLADAETGELITELASSRTDRHFDALRFINSSGGWSPDSKQFAFVVIEEGDDYIAVADVPSGDFNRRIKVEGVNEISHLSWSPDGSKILVSGTKGGISDLYLYDLTTNTTEQLTNDKYADLQPDWSPDGSQIVFSSDRGSETDFNTLVFSPLQLAVMDVSSKDISVISFLDKAKHINPQFSGNGEDVFFVSDPDGFSNIYRYNLSSKISEKLTNTATGISGLTETSPAISYSKQSGDLVFTVFDKGEYSVNRLSTIETKEADTVITLEAAVPDTLVGSDYASATAIPPVDKSYQGIVYDYLNSPLGGLPPEQSYASDDYSPSLGLISVGQVYAGASVSQFGTAIGGGVSLVFSDLLGNHLLGTSLQINGTFKDIGGEVIYLNQSQRFNWGAGIAHIPYLTGYITGSSNFVNGRTIDTIDFVKQRIFIDRVNAIGAYPFSTNRRLEFSVGYTRYSYDFEVETAVYEQGFLVSNETRDIGNEPSALNLFQANAAYVGDYSYFGFTSPIDGSRYRFEAEPTIGTLKFASFLADYRKYFFFNPVTIAVRAMHYGRYFGDSEDNRLSPLQIGFDTWVRGYNLNSFEVTERTNTGDPSEWPEIDRLLGSKVGIFNLEVRLPVFGTEQFGLINFPYLPLEISAFLDGGVAWTKDDQPVIKFEQNSSERVPVFSAGLAARINLFGYIVGQVYYAFPFQRPQKRDGIFGFVLAPGW